MLPVAALRSQSVNTEPKDWMDSTARSRSDLGNSTRCGRLARTVARFWSCSSASASVSSNPAS